MKRIRIGIPLIGGQSWHGGITYIESILKAFHALPSQERPSLHFFITYDQLIQLELFQKLFYLMDEKIVIGGETDQEELQRLGLKKINTFDEILEHVDFIYPVNSSSLPGTPHAVWIPDLQHKELKELFSDDDYLLREQKITLALAGQEKIIVSSKSTYDNFKKYFPEYLDRLEVVHFYSNFELGILKESPLSVVEKYNLPKNFLICCNQFWQHKNHDTLLRALALTNESVHLVCTGAQVDYRNQEWFSKLDGIVTDNNLVSRVTFLGFIPREDQVQLMRQSIAVVQPSKFEGWSTVMEDARALSKPIITSNIDVHVEQNLSKAKYFDKSSPEQLAALMDEVIRTEFPGPNKAEEELAAKEISGLQELAARSLMSIAWSTVRYFHEAHQNPSLNDNLIQELHKTSERVKLNSDTEYFERLVRSEEDLISSLHPKLLALNDILEIRQDRIDELAPKVRSQSEIFLYQERNIKKLDLNRQFFDVILSIQKPKTFLSHCKYFTKNQLLPLSLAKIKYTYSKLKLSLSFFLKVRNKKIDQYIKDQVSRVLGIFQKMHTDKVVPIPESVSVNLNIEAPKLEAKDKLSSLILQASDKKLLINKIEVTIQNTKLDIEGKEAEIMYNETTLSNLLLGSQEKEKIITNLKIHIKWQSEELNNLFKFRTFFIKVFRYISVRVRAKLLYSFLLPIRSNLSLTKSKIKTQYDLLKSRVNKFINNFNFSCSPIELGVLNQHPPKNFFPLRKVAAKRNSKCKISLVTPTFEHAQFIERTILSIQAQGYSKLEYIIQDGDSSDSTKDIIGRYPAIISQFESIKDLGQSHAINLGFKKTTGEIMGWLNSDDMLAPGALDLVAQCFEKNPDVDVVYGNRIIIDSEDKKIGKWLLPEHDNNVLLWADFIPQETMFWRRELWEKCGARIDEDFQFAMDWELILRFREAGANFKRIPSFLGYFRVHPLQKTSIAMTNQGVFEMNNLRKKYLGKIPSEEETYRAILPYLEKHRLENFKYIWKERFGLA